MERKTPKTLPRESSGIFEYMEPSRLFAYFSLKEKGMRMMPHNKIMIPLLLFLLLFSTPSLAVGETLILQEGIDTYISSSSSWNNGQADLMLASSEHLDSSEWKSAFSLVQFALPSWLSTKNIVNAQLELSTFLAYSNSSASVEVNIHRVLEPWEESSVWSDFPSLVNYPYDPDSQDLFDAEVVASSPAISSNLMSFEVTDLVRDWISDLSPNYGVLLKTPYSELGLNELRVVIMFTSNAGGDLRPKLIIEYTETFSATIDFHPETLNLKSKGKWVTCYIELHDGHNVEDIDINTIAITSIAVNEKEAELEGSDGNGIPAETHPTEVGDYDGDGIPDLMVKFERESLQDAIRDVASLGEAVITLDFGMFYDELSSFKGTDTVRIIDKGN